ncbi:helix-turn-helix transcriptional regulator [Acrocarpospora corrugata]|nr:helix-turn-helix domain-containing protein [Acrocarpospora corrugata]
MTETPKTQATPATPKTPHDLGNADAVQAEVIDVVTAGRLLGMGRTKAYRLAQTGQFPCRVLRIGGRYMVPVRGVRALLGYADDEARRGQEHDEKG